MKNFKFLIPAAALMAVSVLSTSCWREDNSSTQVKTTELEIPVVYSLTVTSNVEATFEVAGETQTGTEVTFDNLKDANVSVKATATDAAYSIPSNSQTLAVEFSEEKTTAVADFSFAKASSVQVDQATAKASSEPVKNDNDNAEEFGSVEITVPQDVVITGNTTDPFSVVAFTPAEKVEVDETPAGEDAVNQDIEVPALTLSCEPDGAQFSPALPVKAYIGEEAAGMDMVVDGNTYTVDDEGYINYEAPHFSLSKIKVAATAVVPTLAMTRIATTDVAIREGANKLNYTEKAGFEVLDAAKPTGIVMKILQSVYGKWVEEVPYIVDYSSTATGNGTIEVTQPYKDIVFKSGKKTFKIRLWSKVSITVTAPANVETTGHSGGSAN
ncbi:MAG: hypothetical protein IJ637_07520 [Prevotella sp.]|nr:hypothetical protein [Prevotella sp.]